MKAIDTSKAPHGPEIPVDETTPESPPPKPGLLPTGLSRAIVIGSILLLLAAVLIGLLGDRYSLVATTRTENAFAFRIDRLTGQVGFCSPTACVAIPNKPEPGKEKN